MVKTTAALFLAATVCLLLFVPNFADFIEPEPTGCDNCKCAKDICSTNCNTDLDPFWGIACDETPKYFKSGALDFSFSCRCNNGKSHIVYYVATAEPAGGGTTVSSGGSTINCPEGSGVTCSDDKCECIGGSGSGGSSSSDDSDEADETDDADGSTVVSSTSESGSKTSGGSGAT